MTIRTAIEESEEKILSARACLSGKSKGRQLLEAQCPIRTVFQIDRDRILHSKAFRRLKYKTQVFLAPEGDHYRTRLTHTLEVSQIARTMARALRLNEDLTEAVALGHDLGHTPFGHAGERVLADLLPHGFHHVSQSLRVVDILEKDGRGLNLTWEVRDGIARHSKGQGALQGQERDSLPLTLEGQLVRLADVIAYVNHDLDDAIRGGLVDDQDIPNELRALLGENGSQRINTMVSDLITTSLEHPGEVVHFSKKIGEAVTALRDWLFTNVYNTDPVEADFRKASRVLHELFSYFIDKPEELVSCGGRLSPEDETALAVGDFLAGMTDRFALNLYERLFLPQPWKAV